MRIKDFNTFQKINESFSQSKELEDLLKKRSLDKSFFLDNLMEVSDLSNAKIEYYNYIVDKNGHLINVNVEGEDHKIKYIISIKYKIIDSNTIGTSYYFKELDDLNLIRTSIEELIDRCSTDKSKLSYNKVLKENKYLTFIIHFEGDMSTKELKDAYEKWVNFSGVEYISGLEDLSEIFNKRGIDLSNFIDIIDDNDYVVIGFIIDDDVFRIANYNKSTNKFIIDYDEIDQAITLYHAYLE
jgi:hypothetical protein